jgi:hypothetical protein
MTKLDHFPNESTERAPGLILRFALHGRLAVRAPASHPRQELAA